MQNTTQTKLQYPYLVEHLDDGWAVVFTDTKYPHRVGEFDDRMEAFAHASRLNESYWSQVRASDLARSLIAATSERHEPPASEGVYARLKTRLKALWPR